MARHLRKSAPDTISSKSIAIKAKYMNRCNCGQIIVKGEIVYFDPQVGRIVKCQGCDRLDDERSRKMLVKESTVSYGQKVTDRINQIKTLPLPRKEHLEVELAILIRQLQTNLLHTKEAEAFWLNLARITFPHNDLILNDNYYPINCFNCKREIISKSRVLYCRKTKKTLCLVCPTKELR